MVGRERTSGMTMATVVPEKGSKGKFVVDKCMDFFVECGCRSGDIILKTDQKPAIAFSSRTWWQREETSPGAERWWSNRRLGARDPTGWWNGRCRPWRARSG